MTYVLIYVTLLICLDCKARRAANDTVDENSNGNLTHVRKKM